MMDNPRGHRSKFAMQTGTPLVIVDDSVAVLHNGQEVDHFVRSRSNPKQTAEKFWRSVIPVPFNEDTIEAGPRQRFRIDG